MNNNENEQKLDGYEPMNMSQTPIEQTPVSPVPEQPVSVNETNPVTETPANSVTAPTQNVDTPVSQVAVPTQNIDTPVSQVNDVVNPVTETPVNSVAAPVSNVETPVVGTPIIEPTPSPTQVEQPQSSGLTFTQPTSAPIPPVNTPIATPAQPTGAPKKTKLPIIIAAVVVFVAIAAGVYFIFFRKASNPYTVTTTIFDELATAATESYDAMSSIFTSNNNKKVQTNINFSLDGYASFQAVEYADIANKQIKLNVSGTIDNSGENNINAIITNNALYFNFDEDFGTNYKYNIDLSDVFTSMENSSKNEKVINKVFESIKNSFASTFTEDDFVKSTDGNYDKYTLSISPEKQYELIKSISDSLKDDETIKEYITDILEEIYYDDVSEYYNDIFEIDEKDDFIDNTSTMTYSLYMDGINLKKIELKQESNIITFTFDNDVTTMICENTKTNDKIEIVNSNKILNISIKDAEDEEEYKFEWTKGGKYSLSSTSAGTIMSGNLKIETKSDSQLIDATFNIKVSSSSSLEGSLKLESKLVDSVNIKVPTSALDIETESAQEKLIVDLQNLPLFELIYDSQSSTDYDFDYSYDNDDDYSSWYSTTDNDTSIDDFEF